MNRSAEQLRDWMSRVRRMIKNAAVVASADGPRWCPESSAGVQMELQLGIERQNEFPLRRRRERMS